jgi:protein CpxP
MVRAALVATLVWTVPALAQQEPPVSAQPQEESVTPERQRLERELRARFGQVVRRRLGLSDAQFRQLAAVNRKYEGNRADLLKEERRIRLELRAEILREDRADQSRVAALVDQLLAVQQRRLDMLRSEQRELAAFLTPVQRAKYVALQEQLRRRVTELRRDQGGQPPAAGRLAPRARRLRPEPPAGEP